MAFIGGVGSLNHCRTSQSAHSIQHTYLSKRIVSTQLLPFTISTSNPYWTIIPSRIGIKCILCTVAFGQDDSTDPAWEFEVDHVMHYLKHPCSRDEGEERG